MKQGDVQNDNLFLKMATNSTSALTKIYYVGGGYE